MGGGGGGGGGLDVCNLIFWKTFLEPFLLISQMQCCKVIDACLFPSAQKNVLVLS
jgi:hypothetical protein